MCPCVGPLVPSFGRQLWVLPSRVEYLSPQGVLLPLVYGTIASTLWFELRGPAAWQATPSWAVYRLACHRLLPWLRVTFAMVPDAGWAGSDQRPRGTAPPVGPAGRLGRPSVPDPWGVVCCQPSLSRPGCACVCRVHGPLALVHRCACPVWRRLGVPCVRCPWPLGACSPVCVLSVLCVWCLWLLWGQSLCFLVLSCLSRFVFFLCALCVCRPWLLGGCSFVFHGFFVFFSFFLSFF